MLKFILLLYASKDEALLPELMQNITVTVQNELHPNLKRALKNREAFFKQRPVSRLEPFKSLIKSSDVAPLFVRIQSMTDSITEILNYVIKMHKDMEKHGAVFQIKAAPSLTTLNPEDIDLDPAGSNADVILTVEKLQPLLATQPTSEWMKYIKEIVVAAYHHNEPRRYNNPEDLEAQNIKALYEVLLAADVQVFQEVWQKQFPEDRPPCQFETYVTFKTEAKHALLTPQKFAVFLELARAGNIRAQIFCKVLRDRINKNWDPTRQSAWADNVRALHKQLDTFDADACEALMYSFWKDASPEGQTERYFRLNPDLRQSTDKTLPLMTVNRLERFIQLALYGNQYALRFLAGNAIPFIASKVKDIDLQRADNAPGPYVRHLLDIIPRLLQPDIEEQLIPAAPSLLEPLNQIRGKFGFTLLKAPRAAQAQPMPAPVDDDVKSLKAQLMQEPILHNPRHIHNQNLRDVFMQTLYNLQNGYYVDERGQRVALPLAPSIVTTYAADRIRQIAVRESNPRGATIEVVADDMIAIAIAEQKAGNRPVVIDFANKATQPDRIGGAPQLGAIAQEETFCRQSNLYPGLYAVLRENPGIPEFGGIYLNDVTFFRTPNYAAKQLKEYHYMSAPAQIAVIASWAYKIKHTDNKMHGDMTVEDLRYEAQTKQKIRAQFAIAADQGHDVMITGGFGTGAFKNPPEIIARLYNEVLNENNGLYRKAFKKVIFCIFSPTEGIGVQGGTYRAFKKELNATDKLLK